MITKDMYAKCVRSIMNFYNFDQSLYDVSNGCIDIASAEEISDLVNNFIMLLEYNTKDEIPECGSNLSYFLFDCDQGRNPQEITDANGKPLSLTNVEELWNNFIVKDHPEVEDKENIV